MRHRIVLAHAQVEGNEGVGQGLDGRVERPAKHLIEGARRGVLLLGGLGELLLDLAPVGAGAKHGVGRRLAGQDQPLRHSLTLLHQREGGFPGAARGARRCDVQVGGLCLCGEPAGGGGALERLRIARVPSERVSGEDGRVEDRLQQPEPRIVPLGQGDVEIGGETVGARDLIERGIRGIHEVAQVERPGLLAKARFECDRGQEAAACLAHAGFGALDLEGLLRQPKVVPDGFGHDRRHGISGRLRGGRRGRAEHPGGEETRAESCHNILQC